MDLAEAGGKKPEAMDAARLQWNTDDVKANRPALSRWHADYADAYEAFMRENA